MNSKPYLLSRLPMHPNGKYYFVGFIIRFNAENNRRFSFLLINTFSFLCLQLTSNNKKLDSDSFTDSVLFLAGLIFYFLRQGCYFSHDPT